MNNEWLTFKELARHIKDTIHEKMKDRIHTGMENQTLPTDKAGVTIVQNIADSIMDNLYKDGKIPVRLDVLVRTDQTVQEDIDHNKYGIVNLEKDGGNRIGIVNLLFERSQIQAYRDEKYDSIDMENLTDDEPLKGKKKDNRKERFHAIDGGQDEPQNFNYQDKPLKRIK